MSATQPEWNAGVDASGDMAMRAPGCALGFVGFILALTAAETILVAVPTWVNASLAALLGIALLRLVAVIVSVRWGVSAPDPIQMLLQDLLVVRRRGGTDFQVSLDGAVPVRERIARQALYALKWFGHLLVFAGVGSLLYRLMLGMGIVRT